ncbi:uncharacterized protein C10orf67 homolog, mitochondrial isoform X1 [Varanus komodoensis]|uniref:uncharacterized protein C10orf67 homolog, mitochondrial isoform X1 n=1 Tax=Varanus komodoensis TaxID=61221 RepID=UPI001CF7C321|nr:uncharacterized protein C10orf67 homolog, mitochondrial isoform X1 [Varanus komodoensis]
MVISRPRISEDLKIGFAISDHATQTDISEIGDLKEFITTTRTLLKFTNSVYDDFTMYKSVLKAQYEEKIHEHASNLWQEISDRLKHIEDFYKQKEAKIRYSYQQQLSDALAILRASHTKYFRRERVLAVETEESVAAKIERLRNRIEEQAATIENLEEELQEHKERESRKLLHDRDIETELLQQENWELKEQMASQLQKFTRLQETLKRREKEHAALESEMKHMQERKERNMKTIEKLMNTQEILKLELDREKQRVLSKAREVKEAQDMVEKLKEAAAEYAEPKVASFEEIKPGKGKKGLKGKAAKEAAAKEAAAKEAAAKEVAAKKAAAKEAAAKQGGELGQDQKDPEAEKKALLNEITKLKKAEQEAKVHAQRLEQDLRQSGRSWKMKFEILKRSLHVLKNEMFLRQSLRKSTRFRRASLADRMTLPLHTQSQNIKRKNESFSSSLFIRYSPLGLFNVQPDISSQTASDAEEEDADITKIPFTIEIPSAYESESADEEEVDELPHLPSPLPSVP